jgi:dihydrolipoamide dehydrogenase
MTETYDVIVIGAGPGGYVAAIRAAQLGFRVACVEKRPALGGTCLNVGCIPSKTLLDSSELYAQSQHHFAEHGIKVGQLGLDLGVMLERKNKVVKGLTDGISGLFKKNKITSYQGSARLTAPNRVAVAENPDLVLEATRAVLLATGSEPVGLPALPFDGSHIVSSTEALMFERVPAHLIVVGAGYIGLELGSVWSRLGAKVTVVEFLPRILPLGDAEIAEQLHRSLARQGLVFALETKVTGASTQGGQVVVNAVSKDRDVLFQGDKVLVAVGRKPYTKGLGLQEVGVEVEAKSGRIPVDENYQTNIPGVYAIGDLIQGPMLAHKAEEDGVAFAERLAGQKTHVNYDLVPSVIYTWPEVSSVGQTEEQLKASGVEYRVGRFPIRFSSRARCMGESEGLVKVLADARTDRVLGVHIFAPRASDMIAEAVTIMEFAGSAEDIARICHAHPTLSESLREAALGVAGRAINA